MMYSHGESGVPVLRPGGAAAARQGRRRIAKVRVDLEPARRVEMMEKTGRRTVPQIYIGDTHVGGFDDLVALDRAGKLDPLLRRGAASLERIRVG